LYLRDKAASWFSGNFREGDTIVLEPQSDDEGSLVGFRTGKPSDPAFRGQTSGPDPSNTLFIPVRTDWRDSKSLLGYYNPLTGTYEWTDFLRFLLRAVRSYREGDGLAWFVILDEMNLARVEYYFADLLSVLESGRDAEGWTREPLRLPYPNDAEGDLPPNQVKVPPNLYVIGTVNVDETTHTFSPKVLDRAFTLELTEADFSQYPPSLAQGEDAQLSPKVARAILANFAQGGQFARIDKRAIAAYVRESGGVRERLQTLSEQLRPYQLHFGYRIFDEIVTFLISAEANGLYPDTDTAFDAAVLMKVLPKFHGSRGKLEDPLKRVLAWCLSPEAPDHETVDEKLRAEQEANAAIQALADLPYRYERTAAKCRRMLLQLYTSGFATFS
jgi:5-methylcytosine-specific restriction endonuclease McrBC GTP-binding regulatory subunit McrB